MVDFLFSVVPLSIELLILSIGFDDFIFPLSFYMYEIDHLIRVSAMAAV